MDMNLILNIAIVVTIIAIVGLLWYKGKKKQALQIIAALVDVAESRFGSGKGEYKYSFVMLELYPKLPSIIRTIVSPKVIDKWIEDEVNALQERLKTEINK